MRKQSLSLCLLGLATIAMLSLGACHGSKKARYNTCPTFGKSQPVERPALPKNG